MVRLGFMWIGCLAVAALVHAEEGRTLTVDQQAAIVAAVQPSSVRVEYELQYDKGDEPQAAGWRLRCSNCGRYHDLGNGAELVKEKRPLEAAGWLISPTQVVTADMQIHPRYLKHIGVRIGEKLFDARITGYCRNENGCLLELNEPAAPGKPLSFDSTRAEPYFTVTRQRENGEWSMTLAPLSSGLTIADDGRRFAAAPPGSLIVDASGTAVAVTLDGELAGDDSWKGSPAGWPVCAAEEMATHLQGLESATSNGLLHVTLKFRSPKKASNTWATMWSDDSDDMPTERHDFAILHAPTALLVLADLDARQTARLEKIVVHVPGAASVKAHYGAALRDWGCFTATLDNPLPAPLTISDAAITAVRDELLLAATARFFGDTPIVRSLHARVPLFTIGHERQVYPNVVQDEDGLFLFRIDGALVALPMSRRNPLPDESDDWTDTSVSLTPARYVFSQLADLARHADPNNAPLSEEQENRIAWLGVEMQSLDSDLAMVNKVSEITRDGDIGAMVSFVYPDSPASQAGLQVGDILLQLHVPDHHRPVPVHGDDSSGFGMDFPWEQLGEIPEEYLSEIPQPWPAVQNDFNKLLSGIGFGKTFELEYLRGGESRRAVLTVTESPNHYDSAKRFKSEALGLTVRDLTYEVRRFYQLAADETGVIIGKIEPGSKAYVAGLRPYEIILRVGEDPVVDAAGFGAQLAASSGDVRLNVKRMTSTRVVKLNLAASVDDAKAKDEPAPSPEPAGEADSD